jgi:hypothetical protein
LGQNALAVNCVLDLSTAERYLGSLSVSGSILGGVQAFQGMPQHLLFKTSWS